MFFTFFLPARGRSRFFHIFFTFSVTFFSHLGIGAGNCTGEIAQFGVGVGSCTGEAARQLGLNPGSSLPAEEPDAGPSSDAFGSTHLDP